MVETTSDATDFFSHNGQDHLSASSFLDGAIACPNVNLPKVEPKDDEDCQAGVDNSGMTMTLDNNNGSITFRGTGLEQVLAILGAAQQSSTSSSQVATENVCVLSNNNSEGVKDP